ncbi:MFS transporter [Peribacillus butanolivorans]|uniref:MFS transporter n=1 Tax=Peribacillus butanolivorans TaxID=421767 RepID=UPI003671AB15
MSTKARNIVDDSPLTKFHMKLTIFTAGGPFLDGYILSIVAMALIPLNQSFEINGLWNGLLGSSALIGIFIGGIIFGYLTDRVGRESMYRLDLIAFLVLSILQIFATNVEQLFIIRVLLGIAIGADYPIATSLLTEFAPKKYRGKMIGFLTISWYLGATVAYFAGYFLLNLGPDAWKWMLGSSAIPTIIVILMRLNTPESPRWLLSKGQKEKALRIMKNIYGESTTLEDIPSGPVQKPSLMKLFSSAYRKRTIFVMLFWNFQLIPMFAIYTFAPTLLETFNLNKGDLSHIGSALISFMFLIGCTVSMFFIDRIGRRSLCIGGFFFTTIALLGLGLAPEASSWIIVGLFFMYAFFAGAPAILEWAYPNELFPTEIRGTAVGFATTVTRIGASVGTFGLPIALATFGVGPTMLIAAGLNVIGLLVSVFMAPETKNLSLEEASQDEARKMDEKEDVSNY